MSKKLLLSLKEQQNMVPAFDEHVLFALERRYLDFVDVERLELTMNPAVDAYNCPAHLRMLRIDEVSYQGEALQGLHLLNMQNILAALKDDSHSAVTVIRSDGQRTSLYYGLSKRLESQTCVSTNEYARMLGQTIQGNFLGVRLHPLNADEISSEIIRPVLDQQNVVAFPGIPSLRLKDPNGPYVQGIDRFIEGMRGEKYAVVIIAEPIPLPDVDGMIKNLFDLGTSIHSSVRSTIQKMKGSSDTINLGMFGMKGVSDATTTGESTTDTDSTSHADTKMGLGGLMTSAGATVGAAIGSIVPGVGTLIGGMVGASIGGLGGAIGAYVTGAPLSATDALSQAHSFTRSVANTAGNMMGGGLFGGYARTWNRSMAATQEILNKTAEHCEKLTDAYIARLQGGKNLGFWNVGVYLLAQDKYTQLRGEGLLRSALSGDETYWEPIRSVRVNNEALGQYLINFNNPRYNLFLYGEENKALIKAVTFGSQLREYAGKMGKKVADILSFFNKTDDDTKIQMIEQIRRQPGQFGKEALDRAWAEIRTAQLGHPLGTALGGVSTPLNTEELSIIMNVPREEIRGITIREAASFGVNYISDESPGNEITIGNVIHKREVLDDMPFHVSKPFLRKHGFICGLTGSGKTNTCMNLLTQLDTPFMVVEPAKSEYRQLLNIMPDVKIFTLGNENISPFRINPFEFVPGTELLTHIDYLKTVFNASFPMYASMPYLLEDALVEIYLDKGWELATSTNRYFDVKNTDEFFDYLPTLEDLLQKIDTVVASKRYAQQLSMDLSAALKARLSSLITGSKGLMLNTKRSTPLKELLNRNVILELKYIGDDDEKCFLMGLILTLIYEYREANYSISEELKHITLIEEAHRLLKRVPDYIAAEAANVRGKAVETFTNIISEIREYGEGILIADQIPTKMASDVIKNTSLKIVHRTLSQDDRDLIGATMTLNDAQNRELPLLRVGQAVVHREGLDKPFLLQIPLVKDSSDNIVANEQVRDAMLKFHEDHAYVFRRFPGFEKHASIPSAFIRTDFRRFDADIYGCVTAAAVVFAAMEKQAVMSLRMKVSAIIQRNTRAKDKVSEACQMIWYANRFFSGVSEVYPGRFDKCAGAHRAFIDLWFDAADKIPEQAQLARFRELMSEIADGHEPYDPMILWFVEKSEASKKIGQKLQGRNMEENYEKLDSFLSTSIAGLVLDAPLGMSALKEIKGAMLKKILKNNPFGNIIWKIYASRFLEGDDAGNSR